MIMAASQLGAGLALPSSFPYSRHSPPSRVASCGPRSHAHREASAVSNQSPDDSLDGRRNDEIRRRIEHVEGNAELVSRRWAVLGLPVAAATAAAILVEGVTAAAAAEPATDEVGLENSVEKGGGRVELRTLNGCRLGVARYPDFSYNAEGGGGKGQSVQLLDGRTYVRFDTNGLLIPAVNFDTTTILGLPLPPGLKIEVVPRNLEGYVDRKTGKVELHLLANFNFSAGPLYRAPPLVVDTQLTTESSQGFFRAGQGHRLDSSGDVTLVAVARLGPVNDVFLSTFLTLPTDCLAQLSANLSFS